VASVIEQKPIEYGKAQGGAYNKPLEVLRRHFGLHAEFKSIKQPRDFMDRYFQSDTWIETPNRIWRGSQKARQTTLTFLTLPQQPAGKPPAGTKGKQPANTESAKDQHSISRRFRHALRVLQLELYLHPYQAAILNPEASSTKGTELQAETQDGAEEQWPRLLRILKSGAAL